MDEITIEKLKAGTCLHCGRKRTRTNRRVVLRRGMCEACYFRLRRDMEKLPKVEAEAEHRRLIEMGVLLEPNVVQRLVRGDAWSKED